MIWKVIHFTLIIWTLCGILVFDKMPLWATLLCVSAWVIFYNLKPAIFKIIPYYEKYRVQYKGALWFENFETIDKASISIIIRCGDLNIKNYQIISPDRIDITPQ